MALVSFGRHRIGFWMAERTGSPELPEGLTPQVEGTPTPGGATLVVVGANEEGAPEWALLLHAAEGASLFLPWEDRLFLAVGGTAALVTEDGRVVARRTFAQELLSASAFGDGLLLFDRQEVTFVNRALQEGWQRPLAAEGFHLLGTENGRLRIAALHADRWDEVVLDAATGAIVR